MRQFFKVQESKKSKTKRSKKPMGHHSKTSGDSCGKPTHTVYQSIESDNGSAGCESPSHVVVESVESNVVHAPPHKPANTHTVIVSLEPCGGHHHHSHVVVQSVDSTVVSAYTGPAHYIYESVEVCTGSPDPHAKPTQVVIESVASTVVPGPSHAPANTHTVVVSIEKCGSSGHHHASHVVFESVDSSVAPPHTGPAHYIYQSIETASGGASTCSCGHVDEPSPHTVIESVECSSEQSSPSYSAAGYSSNNDSNNAYSSSSAAYESSPSQEYASSSSGGAYDTRMAVEPEQASDEEDEESA
ncbi:hypothetical protein DL89DRAFT_136060 [Linderina pennispora]|uniref:Uncharacterized protein n=1 Tax=Linderina pennispora TaxID=61395 RepID=A0A1Y1WBD4_9FUNG|nr:uncharacterized protein DL89DRAFT_136060 [Linderina pennispora]ORX70556.1 hypothetical protein DL89DRAFT_136060 [Linderina pennispora]